MNDLALIQRLYQHRAWVNANLLAAAAALSEEQLQRNFAIGQGSIWKSLVHLYGAEFVWLGALEGNEQRARCISAYPEKACQGRRQATGARAAAERPASRWRE